MTTFHKIKDPSCLRKFSLDQLCSIERSVFKLLEEAKWRTLSYRLRSSVPAPDLILQLEETVAVNHDIWTKVRNELESRIEHVLTLEDILNIPVSTDYINQGEG